MIFYNKFLKTYILPLNPGFGNRFFRLILMQDHLQVRVLDFDSSWSWLDDTRVRFPSSGEAANQYFSQNQKIKSFQKTNASNS